MADCSNPNCDMCEGPLRLARERVTKLEEALRESCEDWDKMRMAGIQAAGPRLNKRMEERIARWKGLCEKDE